MQRPSTKKLIGIIMLVAMTLALLSLGVFADGEDAETGTFYATFFALVPPIVAIGLALITKEVYSSLFIGLFVGALFCGNFKPLGVIDALVDDGMIPAVADNAGIFLFLVLLGVMVALINKTSWRS